MIREFLSVLVELFRLFGLWTAFFVAWALVALSLGAAMRPLERRVRIPDWLGGGVVIVLGAVVAVIIVTWVDCAVFIERPWVHPLCRTLRVGP